MKMRIQGFNIVQTSVTVGHINDVTLHEISYFLFFVPYYVQSVNFYLFTYLMLYLFVSLLIHLLL
jgi:hypothetical protein